MGTWPKHLYDNKLAKTNCPGSRKNAKGAIQTSDGGTGEACFPTDTEPPAGVTNPVYLTTAFPRPDRNDRLYGPWTRVGRMA